MLRPAILYGPLNYAPRESVYIRLLVQNHLLPRITDAAGSFQFVYVKDAAEAIMKCLLNPEAYGQAYNLCGEEILTFPLAEEETELYSTEKGKERLGLHYTDISEGMARTYRAFRNVYAAD